MGDTEGGTMPGMKGMKGTKTLKTTSRLLLDGTLIVIAGLTICIPFGKFPKETTKVAARPVLFTVMTINRAAS